MIVLGQVLTAANGFRFVTNYTGNTGNAAGSAAFPWLPLGTVGDSATGEIGLKVISTGGSAVNAGTARAVTASSYAPAYADGAPAVLAVDKTSGGLLTHDRKLTTTDDAVKELPVIQATDYGTTQLRLLTVNSTAAVVKASAGNLYAWNIVNGHSAVIYVKFYNIAAASVNPASSVPILTVSVAASGGNVHVRTTNLPKFFGTAISVRAVTDFGDTGTTAPATLPIIEVEYA